MLRTRMSRSGAPELMASDWARHFVRSAPLPIAYRGVLAAALSVSRAYYVRDKLLWECGRTCVVLLVAQCVVFRKYLLQPVDKFWLRFCHNGQ